jgi:hypothetical protein
VPRAHNGVSKQLWRLELFYRVQMASALIGRSFCCTNPRRSGLSRALRMIPNHLARSTSMPCVRAMSEFRSQLAGVPRFSKSKP